MTSGPISSLEQLSDMEYSSASWAEALKDMFSSFRECSRGEETMKVILQGFNRRKNGKLVKGQTPKRSCLNLNNKTK